MQIQIAPDVGLFVDGAGAGLVPHRPLTRQKPARCGCCTAGRRRPQPGTSGGHCGTVAPMSLFRWKPNPYRPTSPRQRLLLVVLAIAMAAALAFGVLDPQARWERANRLPPDAAACTAAHQTGCVGGRLELRMVAPSAALVASAATVGSTKSHRLP